MTYSFQIVEYNPDLQQYFLMAYKNNTTWEYKDEFF